MKPFIRQSFNDQVIAFEVIDHKLMTRSMSTVPTPSSSIAYYLTIHNMQPSAVFNKLTPSPAANGYHFVVFIPLCKGVIGSMHTYKASAICYIIHEIFLHSFWLHLTIVVADNC